MSDFETGSRVQHKQSCKDARARVEQANTDYDKNWPNHCQECGGRGGFESTYDPSPSGVGLSPGFFYDFDVCGECLDKNKCPRCQAEIGDDFDLDTDGDKCAGCGWSVKDGGKEIEPDCECWFEDYSREQEKYWAEAAAAQERAFAEASDRAEG